MKKEVAVIAVVLFLAIATSANGEAKYNRDFMGVAFSPYYKDWTNGQRPLWNDYNISEIQSLLELVSTKFSSISTYSTGLGPWNKDKEWDQLDANCLVAKAAAEINQREGKLVIKVNQGIYQNEDDEVQQLEIDHALKMAEFVNQFYPGTIWGLTFTNEYIVDERTAQRVLKLLRRTRERVPDLELGVRIHMSGRINERSPFSDMLATVALECDFIYLNIYPSENSVTVASGVQEVVRQFHEARGGFLKVNPELTVMIGETGWPSAGISFNKANGNEANLVEYWRQMNSWASKNKVEVQMFEAVDEPWKCDKSSQDANAFNGPNGAECHFGLWYWTGERFVEKYSNE